jgi:hypothetical protein
MICPTSEFSEFVSIRPAKNISLYQNRKSMPWSRRPASTRGADRDRHETRGGMRWTRQRMRRARLAWTTKSCGPGAPGLALSAQRAILARDGDYEVTDTGKITKISVNTVAQGRPGVSVEPVVNNSCAFLVAHEAAGAASTRFSLRPLFPGGTMDVQASGAMRRGIADLCFEQGPDRCNKPVTSQN